MWTKGGKGVREEIYYDVLWEEWKLLNIPKIHLRHLKDGAGYIGRLRKCLQVITIFVHQLFNDRKLNIY